MRAGIGDIIRSGKGRPDHAGLAYDVWAPVGGDGKVDKTLRDAWLDDFEKMGIPKHYRVAVERFRRSFPPDATLELVTKARLLIGTATPRRRTSASRFIAHGGCR